MPPTVPSHFLGRTALAYFYTLSVCHLASVVYHILAPCYTVRRILMLFGRRTSGVQWHIVLDGGPQTPRGRGDLGGQTPAKTCNCKLLLPPGEYKRTAIVSFVKLLWSLFLFFPNWLRYYDRSGLCRFEMETDRLSIHRVSRVGFVRCQAERPAIAAVNSSIILVPSQQLVHNQSNYFIGNVPHTQ